MLPAGSWLQRSCRSGRTRFSPHFFLLDHGHFGNLMKDTEPLGGRGCWGTHRQVMRELSRGSRIRQTTVREQPGKVLVGLVIAPEGTLRMSQLCQVIPADWVLWSSGVQVYPMKTTAAAKSLQSYPTLWNPMNCSLPGSSIHGTFQASVLEWGAIAFSNENYTQA